MTGLLTFSLTVFTGLIAIMNPVANIPIFLGLVENKTEEEKKSIAKKACIVAFLILVAFTVFGKSIFSLFDITIPAFKITGGILIFYIGFEMLQSKPSSIKNNGNADKDDTSLAVSPLAVPILAGPGTIVTAMNFVANTSIFHMFIVILVSLVVISLNFLAFRSSEFIVTKLGNNIIIVLKKIMGLIIAIIGTDMVINGIKIIS